MERGKFIVFEGVGGSGKTTQIKHAKEYLQEKGIRLLVTREPGGVESAEKIRELIFNLKEKNLIGPEGQVALFFAARKLWLDEVVTPNISEGVSILTDRSHTSTAAYQGYAEGGDMNQIIEISKVVMDEHLPDAVILLDVNAQCAIQRKSKEQKDNDPFDKEGIEYMQKLVNAYREMARDNWGGLDWFVVDGEVSVKQVSQEISRILDKIFEK